MAAWDTFFLKIGGVDAATYGLGVAELSGNWGVPERTTDEATIPGADGTIAMTNEPLMLPRDFVVTGDVTGTSPDDLETKMDNLEYALSAASLTIIGGNQAARQRTGAYKGPMTVTLYPGATSAHVEIPIRCRNPLAYATTGSTVTGSAATDLACALGLARSRPVITVTFAGSAASCVVTLKNYAGTTLTTLTVTHAFVNTDVLIVDCAAQAITVNGSRHDEYLTAGDFFVLDPRAGDPALSHWPTIRVSAGAVSITYSKAYP